ncbi:beta-1,4-N-acetylgalactosaminyltransferase bre-4-like [Mercenaria mercenaria]|uniref:beta-1,4-N-acetylgalactosaminyltransferase bre-4-like n=1 Tax=Mercenaria mercenaria TaxID=6596 RepID=UPI00234F78BC|nr:beta-1,4-N-acetylgalactosaminyltransferase bre-4-like [Mercenaria mercenaria]
MDSDRTDMLRNKLVKSFPLYVVLLTILLYLYWTLNESVSVEVEVKPICKSVSLNSFYNISTENISWEVLEHHINNVLPGGRYTPPRCISRWRVAIIVPYRDRENHLKVFLRNIHPFLQQQRLDYGIFVIEMETSKPFNRGLLMNVGFNESRRLYNYNCFIFHDVDLLPRDTRNSYCCSGHPKRMVSVNNKRNYTKTNYFGGVNAFSKDHFIRVNGFPNMYSGWGREDDDLYHRVLNAKLTVQKLPFNVGRYTNLGHQQATLAKEKYFSFFIFLFYYRLHTNSVEIK